MTLLELFEDKSKKFRAMVVLIGLVLTVIFIIFYLKLNISITCLLVKTTGLWCPLCGGTRSFINLIHGNIAVAFKYNELFIGTLPLTIGYTIKKLIEYVNAGKIEISRNVIKYTSLVMLVYMIIRNIIFKLR